MVSLHLLDVVPDMTQARMVFFESTLRTLMSRHCEVVSRTGLTEAFRKPAGSSGNISAP